MRTASWVGVDIGVRPMSPLLFAAILRRCRDSPDRSEAMVFGGLLRGIQ
jgi:hypothetical protein